MTVSYVTNDGTAVANLDYTPVSGTVTFDPGVTTQQVSVPVLDDGLNNANVTVLLLLTTATNAILPGGFVTGTGTIIESDPLPLLSVASQSIGEPSLSQDVYTFEATLSAPSRRTITADWALASPNVPNAAVAGVNYEAASGQITFAPGEVSQNIYVTVLNNGMARPDRIFNINFSNVVGADATMGNATVTILDINRAPKLKVSLGSFLIENLQQRPVVSWGIVLKGSKPPVRTFRIGNIGTDPLRIGSVVLPKGLQLVTAPAEEVEPKSSTTFSVRMTTVTPALRWGQIFFYTNVVGAKPFHFAVVGQVLSSPTDKILIPQILLAPNQLIPALPTLPVKARPSSLFASKRSILD